VSASRSAFLRLAQSLVQSIDLFVQRGDAALEFASSLVEASDVRPAVSAW
jgi:hypothetical protein